MLDILPILAAGAIGGLVTGYIMSKAHWRRYNDLFRWHLKNVAEVKVAERKRYDEELKCAVSNPYIPCDMTKFKGEFAKIIKSDTDKCCKVTSIIPFQDQDITIKWGNCCYSEGGKLMEFMRSGSLIFKVKLTANEKRALDAEIKRQLAEYTRKYQVEIESIFLRHQRTKHGFGAKRLREDFDNFGNELDELIKRLEMGQEDKAWLATYLLKEEGFDVEQWHREKYPNDENFA